MAVFVRNQQETGFKQSDWYSIWTVSVLFLADFRQKQLFLPPVLLLAASGLCGQLELSTVCVFPDTCLSVAFEAAMLKVTLAWCSML